jgi:hypothetical protein
MYLKEFLNNKRINKQKYISPLNREIKYFTPHGIGILSLYEDRNEACFSSTRTRRIFSKAWSTQAGKRPLAGHQKVALDIA